MTRWTCLISSMAFVLAAGCSREQRAQRHEEEARSEYTKGQKEIAEGQANARDEAREAREKAQEHFAEAQDERAKANEVRNEPTTPYGERQPVAGSERYDSPLASSVHDELGDDWSLSHQGPFLVAQRTKASKADKHMSSKILETKKAVREDKDRRGLSISNSGDKVTLKGTVKDCEDAAKVADDFAGIDGIDRIEFDVNCAKK